MNCILINIGDELLIGQIINTNASWLASCLNDNGIRVHSVITIADNRYDIESKLQAALDEVEIVILTGGLGPTKDDITKQTLCDFFHSEMFIHQPTLNHIAQIFEKRGYEMSATNRKQAEIPICCQPLFNQWGTAPGMWFEREGKIVVSLPGVPCEMQGLMQTEVIPRLNKMFESEQILHRSIWTFGIGESFLSDKIEAWELNLPSNIHLAYLPTDGMVRLRLSMYGHNRNDLMRKEQIEEQKLKSLLGDYIWGYDDDTLEQVVGKKLVEKGCTLSTVESCTGGFLAHKITSIAGASTYYKGGAITYSNEIKEKIVGVKTYTLEQYGAVSRQTAEEMACGCRLQFGTDYAVATTGIAGPDGGTYQKPVGTVWIAIATPYGVEARIFTYGDDRLRTIARASNQALYWLLQELKKK